jgi:glycyl-tRNA synthetase
MNPLYDKNGLMFWNEEEILIREMLKSFFVQQIQESLRFTNPSWKMVQIEAPILTPKELIDINYTHEDIYQVGELVLRPETTPGSYQYAKYIFNQSLPLIPPLCIWQIGKSFRREQDQVIKNIRLKEFYQLEFQCIYTEDSKAEYSRMLYDDIKIMFEKILKIKMKIEESNRLPSYSLKTIDLIEDCKDGLELCSMSLRKDFTTLWNNKKLLVFEIAIGLDRCVYSFLRNKEIV